MLDSLTKNSPPALFLKDHRNVTSTTTKIVFCHMKSPLVKYTVDGKGHWVG